MFLEVPDPDEDDVALINGPEPGIVPLRSSQPFPVRMASPIPSKKPRLRSGVSKSACASNQTTPSRPLLAAEPGDSAEAAVAIAR
jgi:hypothetical protein